MSVRKILAELEAAGLTPRVELLAHGLADATTALRVEAAAIDLMGLESLANIVRGHYTKFGRAPLEEVVALYTKKKAKIIEPSILIRINRLYRYGMSGAELYDATRSAWVVGGKREQVELAFAVYESVVREVYAVQGWHPGVSTFNVRTEGRRAERGTAG